MNRHFSRDSYRSAKSSPPTVVVVATHQQSLRTKHFCGKNISKNSDRRIDKLTIETLCSFLFLFFPIGTYIHVLLPQPTGLDCDRTE